jgi:hypothetical protein
MKDLGSGEEASDELEGKTDKQGKSDDIIWDKARVYKLNLDVSSTGPT